MAYDSTYGFEVWSPSGSLLADLTGLAKNRSYTKSRNRPEDIAFSLDLDDFEKYCRRANITNIKGLLQPDVNEIRVRRNGTYLVGGQIIYAQPSVADTHKIEVRATGFLNLFKDRYTPTMQSYNSIEASQIAASLITDTQTGGNLISNPDFETSLSGWSSSGAVITRTAEQAYYGTYSMKATFSGDGQTAGFGYATFNTNLTYQGGFWAYIPVGQQVIIRIMYTGGAGITALTYNGTGSWRFISTEPQLAGTVSGQIQIVSVGSSIYSVYIDQAILSVNDALIPPIIDGVNVLDFGVTINSITNVGVKTRNYQRTNIKDALIALTEVQTSSLDFEFTYDKKFNTYKSIGSTRNDIIFEYPNNINKASYSIDGTSMGNQIIGIGQGNGEITQLVLSGIDTASLKTYKLRQRIYNSSATDNSDNGLTDGVATELARWSNPIRLLDIEVDGSKAPYVTDYNIGDRVPVNVSGYDSFVDASGMYRIEQIAVDISDNDTEKINLTVS